MRTRTWSRIVAVIFDRVPRDAFTRFGVTALLTLNACVGEVPPTPSPRPTITVSTPAPQPASPSVVTPASQPTPAPVAPVTPAPPAGSTAPSALALVPSAGRIALIPPEGRLWLYDGTKGIEGLDGYGGKPSTDGHAFAFWTPGLVKSPRFIDLHDSSIRIITPVPLDRPYSISSDGQRAAYVDGGTLYVKDPERGLRVAFPDYVFSGVGSWSPSGRRLVVTGPTLAQQIRPPYFARSDYVPCDLWVVDFDAKTLRQVFVHPSMVVRYDTEHLGCAGVAPGAWSPDERYLTVFLSVILSAGLSGEPKPLAVVDLASGVATPLGTTVEAAGWQGWRAPHTLAYVTGAGRSGWEQRILRSWSPEDGRRDLTGPAEAVIDPVWDPSGRAIYFVSAPADAWDAESYFTGKGIGSRHIVRLELATGKREQIANTPGFIEEGLRVSADGADLLIARRRIDTTGIELWLWPAAGGTGVPVLRIPLGRYDTDGLGRRYGYDVAYWYLITRGSYALFDSIAWSR